MGLNNPSYSSIPVWQHYGNGIDGAYVVAAPVALPLSIQCTSLHVLPGIALNTNGHIIVCSGDVLNEGLIWNDAIGRIGAVGAELGAGLDGGLAVVGAGVPGVGDLLRGIGSNGGNGGLGAGGAGGAQGVCAVDVANAVTSLLGQLAAHFLYDFFMQSNFGLSIGAGGGSGAGDGGVNAGGDGGGGGGHIVIIARRIINVAGTIRAAGGNGADGPAANCGGGGGGGGGIIDLISTNVPTGAIEPTQGFGGAAGAGAVAGNDGIIGTYRHTLIF